MFLAGEVAPELPGLDQLMPAWAQDLSLLGILILIVAAFMRNWIVTKAQNERDVAAERRVSDIWENTAQTANSHVDKLTEALQPVLEGNEAILKAVSEVQEEQRRMRGQRGQR